MKGSYLGFDRFDILTFRPFDLGGKLTHTKPFYSSKIIWYYPVFIKFDKNHICIPSPL